MTAAASYGFGLWAYQASGQTGTGNGGANLSWYTSVDCTSGSISTIYGATSTLFDMWQNLSNPANVAPAGAQSALLVIFGFKNGAAGSYQVYLDDAYVGVGLVPVTLQRFTIE